MNNYELDQQESIARFILQNMSRHGHFALATTDDQNKPWAVCVNLCFDEQANFIWRSQVSSEHSKNLRSRPDVAICVFSKTEGLGDFGFYGKAVAHEVNDPTEAERLWTIRFKGREAPPVEEFLGDSPTRLYYAEVTEAWVTDSRHLKTAVDLNVLRKLTKNFIKS